MNIVTDILEILIGFFIMASLMATPTCIFGYFIISLVKYLKQKKKLDADCLKNHSKMKRAKINLAVSSCILISMILIVCGVFSEFFLLFIVYAIPISCFIYFVLSLIKYKKEKRNYDGDFSGKNDTLKEAKRDLVTSSILVGFFILIIISLIYAFTQELFYM